MADYTLRVSDAEISRYRIMAQHALEREADQLAAAGVVPGAVVADVGCGPAAMTVELARMVGPSGRAIGVEREDEAIAAARQVVEQSGVDNVELIQASATSTGIPAGSVDLAMTRHVLAHNGGDEQNIVDHLASLVRSGGSVYLVDVDLSMMRIKDMDPDLADVSDRYVEFHRARGNDPQIGLRLGDLLAGAGLDVVSFTGFFQIFPAPPGLRPPQVAAREAMIAQGTITAADADRWEAAFERMDTAPKRPTLFTPVFVGIGRKP